MLSASKINASTPSALTQTDEMSTLAASGDEHTEQPSRAPSPSGSLAGLGNARSSKRSIARSASNSSQYAGEIHSAVDVPSTPQAAPAESSGSIHVPDSGSTAYTGKVFKQNGYLESGNGAINALLKYCGAANPESPINQFDTSAQPSIHIKMENLSDKFEDFSGHFGDASIAMLQQTITTGSERLPADIKNMLLSAAPQISSEHAPLSQHINQKLHENPELRIRLGAEALLQHATEKQFDLKGLAGSIFVSAGIGSAWELGLSHVVKQAIFGHGFSPSKFGLKLAGIDSVPPLLIETLDTMCVLTIMKTMSGDKDWKLKDLLPKALMAGGISAAFSYPNNVMEYKSTGSKAADILLSTATTTAAVWSAASGVPLEVEEDAQALKEGIKAQIDQGLLSPPPAGQTLDEYVNKIVKDAMAISPKDGIAQKSMGFATVIGLLPLVLSNKVSSALSDSALRIMRSTLFNPIEAISLNFLAASAKLNIPWVTDSDYQKHSKAIQLILENAQPGDAESVEGHVKDIPARELQHILAPRREFLRQTGEGVIWAMNGMFHGLSNVAGALNSGAKWAVSAARPSH